MAYEYEAHAWVKMKGIGRDRCKRCGLMALRNKFTEFCIRMGCDHEAHPRYKYEYNHCRET